MAQYGHNWYGTSYYGETNAFSGWYQTKELFTEQPLKNTVNVNIRATLPSASYGPTATEVFQQTGTWIYDTTNAKLYSDNANAQLVLTATADEIVIQYEQRTIAALVHISVETTLPGQAPATTTYDLNTQASTVNSNATYVIDGLAFGQQKVTITIDASNPSGTGSNFNFKGFTARTANLTIESRARLLSESWPSPYPDAAYAKLTTTITPVQGSTTDYIVSGTTPSYTGKDHIQFKIYLASSDNATTPEVQYVEVVAGDSNNRTSNGEWTATFNMLNIASQAGVSFSYVDEVTWTENVPATTTLTVRSQSLTSQGFKDYVTVPYKQGVNRIRLRDGHNNGWFDTPVNAPAQNIPYATTTDWNSWSDEAFFPPDKDGAGIEYRFINRTKDNVLTPYYLIDRTKSNTSILKGSPTLKNFDNVIRITLSRSPNKQTPVVDFIHLVSDMHYQQDYSVEGKDFSAVDNHNTGKDIILDMNTIKGVWVIPSATSNPTYQLIDNTKRPTDISLYYDSEQSSASRSNKTTNQLDKIWAETKTYDPKTNKGLMKNYQYGGGQVKYPLTDEIQMASNFTPSLKNLHYRYHLDTGWPQEYYTTQKGDTLANVANVYGKTVADFTTVNPKPLYDADGTLLANQSLKIPNDSINSNVNIFWKSTNSDVTNKSSKNALLDGLSNVESDSISATVKQSSVYGLVNWVSEEKIFDGVINLNGAPADYKRTHPASTSASDGNIKYTAVNGDTYAGIANVYNVYEDDVRWLNGATSGEEPTAGQVVLIPPPFSLPWIDPQAIISSEPYTAVIVFNSVKKDDGTILSESIINSAPLSVTYEEIESTAQITRGSIANGKDLLPSPMVTSITSVTTSTVTYNEWNDTLGVGDFKLTDNNIDWSPATGAAEPTAGTIYTVVYKHNVPKDITVDFSTLYYEEGGVDHIWRSPEVKQFTGMCYPGNDYVADLPDFNQWQGLPDNNVEDLAYVIEDNDLWVKTWAEQRNGKWVIVGSLQDRVPKDNWFPTIKTGYYYLGQDEYYLFSEPIVLKPGEEEVPTAKNVEFVPAKFDNGAKVQEASQNIILNSGFDVSTTTNTVFKLTF